ncbi:MAG: 50S ribosomal protein L1 [Thermoguttaceae bacterium]
MPKLTKRFKSMNGQLKNVQAALPLADAVGVLKKFDNLKFNQSVDVAICLGIDPKQADQLVRGSIVLPHGIGKESRVCVIAKGDKAAEAKSGGADFVGDADIVEKIKGGWTDFDVCIATPDMMGLVGPLGKVLGPRGLMPSPRAGTVTMDVVKTIKEYKAGKVEFRNDKEGGVVHAIVGKIKFDAQQLVDNLDAFIKLIVSLKPTAVKGQYIKSVTISATMSPGVRVAI